VNIVSGIYTKGMNDVVDFYLWGGEAYKPFKLFEKAFIDGKSFELGAVKELEACRGMVISDYQNYLEESWIKSLRKKYKVKVDKKVLLSLVTAK
jgi:peptidyl-prolyl cis-trans isomerase SurA